MGQSISQAVLKKHFFSKNKLILKIKFKNTLAKLYEDP